MMNPWRGLGGLPREVWLICASTLVNRLGTMALPFLVLYLTQGRGWSLEAAGGAMAAYGLGALVTSPFSGRLSDRVGHLRMMKAGLWGSGLALMVLPLVPTRPLLHGLIFLWAAFSQAFWPSSLALLAEVADPARRKAVYSLHRLVVNLGMSVGPAMGGLISHRSYAPVFWVDGVTSGVSAFLLGLLLAAPAAPARPRRPVPRSSHRAWRDLRLMHLLSAFFLVLLVATQIEGVLPLWVVRELRFGNPFFGFLFTVNTLLIVALEVPLNLRMAHGSQGPQMLAGALCYAAGFGLMGWATTRGLLVGTLVIWTFGEMILFPAVSDAVASLAPRDRLGEYMGLYSATFAAGFTLGPWLGVLAFAQIGGPWLWLGGGLCAAMGGCALWRFRGLAHRPAGPSNPR